MNVMYVMYACMYICIYIYICMYIQMILDALPLSFNNIFFPFTNGTIGAMRFISFCMIRQQGDRLKLQKALIEIIKNYTWKLNTTWEPISQNYYPINTRISIKDDKRYI